MPMLLRLAPDPVRNQAHRTRHQCIGNVTGKVMHRISGPAAERLIPSLAVIIEALEAIAAMLTVDPGGLQDASGSLDGVGFVFDSRHHDERDTELFGDLFPRFSG